MSAEAILVVALIAVGAICVGLVALTVTARIARRRRDRRLQALSAPHRLLLLRVASGEDDDHAALDQLTALSADEWVGVRPAVFGLLGKVRGAPADALISVIRERGEVDRARTKLSARSRVRRARAAHLLGLVRDPASVPGLVVLLDDPDEDVRVVSARSLGRIGDATAAVPVLRAAGPRTGASGGLPGLPAWIAAEVLLALGEGAAGAVEEGVRSTDPVVRSVAVTVATHGVLPGAVDLVRDRIATEPDLDVLGAMVDCLGRVGGAEDATLLLGLTRAGTAPGLRRQAVRALGSLGGPAAATRLGELLSDDDRATAVVAAEALVEMGPAGTAVLHEERRRHPRTGRVVSAALHLAGLRGGLRPAS